MQHMLLHVASCSGLLYESGAVQCYSAVLGEPSSAKPKAEAAADEEGISVLIDLLVSLLSQACVPVQSNPVQSSPLRRQPNAQPVVLCVLRCG